MNDGRRRRDLRVQVNFLIRSMTIFIPFLWMSNVDLTCSLNDVSEKKYQLNSEQQLGKKLIQYIPETGLNHIKKYYKSFPCKMTCSLNNKLE